MLQNQLDYESFFLEPATNLFTGHCFMECNMLKNLQRELDENMHLDHVFLICLFVYFFYPTEDTFVTNLLFLQMFFCSFVCLLFLPTKRRFFMTNSPFCSPNVSALQYHFLNQYSVKIMCTYCCKIT